MHECTRTLPKDLPRVARCHARAFPRALSTLQGPRFVEKMLEWYVAAERGVLFHVEEGTRVAGYCGAIRTHESGAPGAFTSISQYAFWTFVAAYLLKPWLILHPENVKKRAGILRNILIRIGIGSTPSLPRPTFEPFQSYWGLVVIGVDPEDRGKGLGGVLLREFEEQARRDGARVVQLTVRSGNQSAVALYERNGWAVVKKSEDDLFMQKQL